MLRAQPPLFSPSSRRRRRLPPLNNCAPRSAPSAARCHKHNLPSHSLFHSRTHSIPQNAPSSPFLTLIVRQTRPTLSCTSPPEPYSPVRYRLSTTHASFRSLRNAPSSPGQHRPLLPHSSHRDHIQPPPRLDPALALGSLTLTHLPSPHDITHSPSIVPCCARSLSHRPPPSLDIGLDTSVS